MIKYLIPFLIVFPLICVFPQTPQKIHYQLNIRNANQEILRDTIVGLKISIIQGSVSGTPVFIETHTITTNNNGLANIIIGNGTLVWGNISKINWAEGPYFIKTETDLSGGKLYNSYVHFELLSVPYALYSLNGKPGPPGTPAAPGKFYLGQDTLGGIVFYIYKDKSGQQHGLIVSVKEIRERWEITPKKNGAFTNEDGTYNFNLMPNDSAKKFITSLGPEWYLPSIDELKIVWQNRLHVNKTSENAGYPSLSLYENYWSSTEQKQSFHDNALTFNFKIGVAFYYRKTDFHLIRAIRLF